MTIVIFGIKILLNKQEKKHIIAIKIKTLLAYKNSSN